GISRRSKELHVAPLRQMMQQPRIIRIRWLGVVSSRADDAQARIRRQRLEQAIDAFVWRETAHEQNAATRVVRVGREASRVGPAVDHARLGRWCAELLG